MTLQDLRVNPRSPYPRGVGTVSAAAVGWIGQLLLVAVALWPVWLHVARAYAATGAERTGALVLLGALVWAVYLASTAPAERGESSPLLPGCLLLAFVAAYPFAPPLLRAALGLLLVGVVLVDGIRGGLRERSGLIALLVLGAPCASSLDFFLGGPLRAVSSAIAAAGLATGGVPARADGIALWVGGQLYSVDAPCSGINGLWSLAVVGAVLAVHRRLSPLRTVFLMGAAVVLSVPANAWRVMSLVFLDGLPDRMLWRSAEGCHSDVGLVVFAVSTGLLLGLAGAAERVGGSLHRRWRLPDLSRFRVALPSRTGAVLFVVSSVLAMLVPLSGRTAAGEVSRAPQLPGAWLGAPLRRLPEAEMDRRWAASGAGDVSRFTLPGGEELLLRWVPRANRALHPVEDCYRGLGYTIVPLSPVRTVAPAVAEPGWPPGRVVVWRRFLAQRPGESLEVRDVLLSTGGGAYSDPAWWWWCVAGPGASDRGPWWSVTVQSRRS